MSETDILYKKNSSGKIQSWVGRTKVEGTKAFKQTTYGVVGGKLITTDWQEVFGKNLGKKNETSPHEQAMLEIHSDYEKKLDKLYTLSTDGVAVVPYPTAMLAKDYKKFGDRIWERGQGPVMSQPKLDGIRCMINNNGMWTRGGKPILSCPHILEEVKPLFVTNPDLVLDGELYNHEYNEDFQKLVSVIRKQKATTESLKLAKEVVEFHVYDMQSDKNFASRSQNLTTTLRDIDCRYVKRVETTTVAYQGELDELYQKYMEQGYEGQMVRWSNDVYAEGRSVSLLKRKEFDTAEFDVVSVWEGHGNWQGAVKKFGLLDENNNKFSAGVRGDRDTLTELYKSGKVPSWATVRYFGTSNDGIPRFPVVIDYGFGERDD